MLEPALGDPQLEASASKQSAAQPGSASVEASAEAPPSEKDVGSCTPVFVSGEAGEHHSTPAQPQQSHVGDAAHHGQALAAPTALVQHCWSTAFDYNSHRWYFYNTATGQTQWNPPPGWMPAPALRPSQAAPTATAAADSAQPETRPQLPAGCEPVDTVAVHRSAGPAAAAAAGVARGIPEEEHSAPAGTRMSNACNNQAGSQAADPSDHHKQQAQQECQAQEHTPQHAPQPQVQPSRLPTAAAAAATHAAPSTPGYYYYDAYASLQGPFTKEQLLGWRALLPMDLPLICIPPSSAQQGQQAQLQGQHAPQREQAQHSELAGVRVAASPGELELAQVLGDGHLLARWREDNPAKATHPNSAPTAAAYEEELGVGGGGSGYAAAALAGLPAHDDAVQVARLAAYSGRSIQDLLSFNYGSGGLGDYTATALHSRGRGRIQAAGTQEEGLYDEMSSWVDASTVEQQLAKAAERRRKGLSGKELQALKARKLEMKKKKTMDWLIR